MDFIRGTGNLPAYWALKKFDIISQMVLRLISSGQLYRTCVKICIRREYR